MQNLFLNRILVKIYNNKYKILVLILKCEANGIHRGI